MTNDDTDHVCLICDEPIAGEDDTVAHPTIDGAPVHLVCLESAVSKQSPDGRVRAGLEALEAIVGELEPEQREAAAALLNEMINDG